jgi:hypothetical protein
MLMLLTMALPAVSLDSSLWSGLKIVAEPLPDGTRVNGVPVRAIRFTGTNVPELEQRWLSMRGPSQVRTIVLEAWRVHTVLDMNTSEVLQIRQGAQPELIWSSLDVSFETAPTPRRPTLLPAACLGGRTVELGRGPDHFIQYSAHCRSSAGSLSRILADSLRRRGFAVLHVSPQGMEAASKMSHISIAFLPPPGQDGSAATLVSVLERDLPRVRP